MPADLAALLADLTEETRVLADILDGVDEHGWRTPTPAEGWTVADQVGHLAYFDETTLLSLADPDRFLAEAAVLIERGENFPDQVAADHRNLTGAELHSWFRAARKSLLDGYASAGQDVRLPWYGTEMGVASSITARLMETWAHGQDIADALGVTREPTARLRHVAHLGIRALPFSYVSRGRPVPTDPIRVELTAPDGATWAWGPAGAADRITGSALGFCLVVTQRRHRDDTDVHATGPTAQEWIAIAQAFAGRPTPGRPPRGRPA
jgi:uncharacterized protein (TIGR03084 family)